MAKCKAKALPSLISAQRNDKILIESYMNNMENQGK